MIRVSLGGMTTALPMATSPAPPWQRRMHRSSRVPRSLSVLGGDFFLVRIHDLLLQVAGHRLVM